ncbi:protein FAR1-RELATED SEQUENCE 1-like [Spinacia oleracea]|uniref:Protein FAR1-RELATED SEQUENCE 1-like n=1 Tax=Spinacia oleracea TaxID=3562 RepID=A0ABM3QQ16_SPIOL|nr:protein FAR1-RELATED SEQUENCE 1-like [Spinacia oleracea]
MGYTGETVEEVLGFYKKHASAIGFSIRKTNIRFKAGTRIVLEKIFLCSGAGVTNNGKNKKKKVETIVPVVPKKERKPRHVPITRTGCRVCLRVKMNSQGRSFIHDFFLTTCMEIEAGGEENLGHSKKDHLNYCTRLKMKQIEGGDAQAVTDIMYLELEGDPNFFFRFRLDEEGKLRSLFWRDSMMMEDYGIYGDIVVFPDARHILCVWHLHQNAITRSRALNRDPTFKKTFNYCLYKCVTEVEFETNWRSMLQTYELIGEECESTNHAIDFRENRTTSLTDIYSLLKGTIQRWRSTEKEAELSCSKSVASPTLPLSGLLKHASEVYMLSLFRDVEEEFGYSIATTAKLIWTQGESQKLKFSIFEKVKFTTTNASNTQFYVVSIDEEPWSAQRVTYIYESQTVSCTCKNFEDSGWLCYHCIRILHLHSVNWIPEQYIKKRWT